MGVQDGTVRDGYFEKRPLEFYMKDHTGKSEPTGKWKPGNIIKKCVENVRRLPAKRTLLCGAMLLLGRGLRDDRELSREA